MKPSKTEIKGINVDERVLKRKINSSKENSDSKPSKNKKHTLFSKLRTSVLIISACLCYICTKEFTLIENTIYNCIDGCKKYVSPTQEKITHVPKKHKLATEKLILHNHFSCKTDSYYLHGQMYQWFSIQLVIDNNNDKPEFITDIEIDFWIDGQWQSGIMRKGKFSLPQKLDVSASNDVYVEVEIPTKTLYNLIVAKIKLQLFSGNYLEKKVTLSK